MESSLPFIFCSICYSQQSPLYFTSCGHVLCDFHASSNTNPCFICKTSHLAPCLISSLPKLVKSFFTSTFLPVLDGIHGVARFQYNRLVELFSHQTLVIQQLNEKVQNQRQALAVAHPKILKARDYKS